MMKTRLKTLLLLILLVSGGLLGGRGLYMDAKAWLAQVLIAHSWDKNLAAGSAAAKPWPWADTYPVAKITFPRLNETQYAMHDASGESLAFGAGVLAQGVLPAEKGDSVVAGHRDTHFAFVRALRLGDEIIAENLHGHRQHYRITRMTIVNARTENLTIAPHQYRLRLITCYPFDAVSAGGPLRYVVEAEAKTESRG